ncbi:uncharacterized protein LOC115139876 [Oncorhynchus nerka]|uniref:uncharacterized protein LOC115139876 n=1 Tax=Oncorhynchus nerka TaxID=8023 RepID=UPI0031B84B55
MQILVSNCLFVHMPKLSRSLLSFAFCPEKPQVNRKKSKNVWKRVLFQLTPLTSQLRTLTLDWRRLTGIGRSSQTICGESTTFCPTVTEKSHRLPQKTQLWDGFCFYPIPKAMLHHQSRIPLSIGPAVWHCLGCGGAMVVVHWPPSAISHWCQTVPSGSVAAPTSAVSTLCNQTAKERMIHLAYAQGERLEEVKEELCGQWPQALRVPAIL